MRLTSTPAPAVAVPTVTSPSFSIQMPFLALAAIVVTLVLKKLPTAPIASATKVRMEDSVVPIPLISFASSTTCFPEPAVIVPLFSSVVAAL